jgi:hypothetical protein
MPQESFYIMAHGKERTMKTYEDKDRQKNITLGTAMVTRLVTEYCDSDDREYGN